MSGKSGRHPAGLSYTGDYSNAVFSRSLTKYKGTFSTWSGNDYGIRVRGCACLQRKRGTARLQGSLDTNMKS